ncbi:MAG: DUF4170 domain-containing protein [Azospirillum sp.]|nr:DUF4170 domain-containing protein [Azospirillum sp.]
MIARETEDGMATRFWVEGGEHADATFTALAAGKEERHGPFATYEEARAVWQARTMATIDNALARFKVVVGEGPTHVPAAAGPKTWWVEGSEYADATFTTLVAGRPIERHGPHATYEAAKKDWQARTMATVDNALIRFRIVEG